MRFINAVLAIVATATSVVADSVTWAKADSTQLRCDVTQNYHATIIEDENDINKTSCEDLVGTYPNGTWAFEALNDAWTIAAMNHECLIWFRGEEDAANVT